MTTSARCVLRAAALPVLALLLTGCGAGPPTTPRTTTITVTPSEPPPSTSSTTTPATTTTPTASPPTSYEQAIAHFATGQVDDQVKGRFSSPTGNIFCDMGTDGSTNGCELKTGRIPPPTADFCPAGGAKDIGRVELTPQGPKAVCSSDTIVKPGSAILTYGSISRITGSPLQCLSESIGMTCLDTTAKKGFFLARDTFLIF